MKGHTAPVPSVSDLTPGDPEGRVGLLAACVSFELRLRLMPGHWRFSEKQISQYSFVLFFRNRPAILLQAAVTVNELEIVDTLDRLLSLDREI